MVIGGVEVPNREVKPPKTTRLADEEGNVTDIHYRLRAGPCSPDPTGRAHLPTLNVSSLNG
jgi:hypothetical protein